MTEKKNNEEINKIIQEIGKLNLGEVSELIGGLKEVFGIKEDVVIQSATSASTGEKSEEKGSNVSLKLLGVGPNRIQVYKEIVNIMKEQKGEVISPIQA